MAILILHAPMRSSSRRTRLSTPTQEGQAKVRFSGSSAKAIAQTGVGIGDRVVLTLQGAQFVQEELDAVQTPGRSIDWELLFSQTLVVRIYRDETEIASLNIVDVAPTPAAAASPVRQSSPATPYKSPAMVTRTEQQWSSPAFLKRAARYDGSFMGSSGDVLSTNEIEDEHDRKRRRKSYRDWDIWTYTARTPSPEESRVREDGMELEPEVLSSHVPVTPVSPSEANRSATADLPAKDIGVSEPFEISGAASQASETLSSQSSHDVHDRKNDHDDLYTGPERSLSPHRNHVSRESTDEHTESEAEEEASESVQRGTFPSQPSVGAAESGDEEHGELRDGVRERSSHHMPIMANGVIGVLCPPADHVIPAGQSPQFGFEGSLLHLDSQLQDRSTAQGHVATLLEPATSTNITMPPPGLTTLQTDFAAHTMPSPLTPIGREPSSPVIKPLDSSTLPMPSPFPGEREGISSSFLDRLFSDHPPSEPVLSAGAIADSSFFDLISSANTPAFQPTHESAFTDLRFNFGLDGAMLSRTTASSEFQEHLDANLGDSIDHTDDMTDRQLQRHIADPFDTFTEDRMVIAETASFQSDAQTTDLAVLEHKPEAIVYPSNLGQGHGDGDGAVDLVDDRASTQTLFDSYHSPDTVDTIANETPIRDSNESQLRRKAPIMSTWRSNTDTNIVDLGSGSDIGSDEVEVVARGPNESTRDSAPMEGAQTHEAFRSPNFIPNSPTEQTPLLDRQYNRTEDDDNREPVVSLGELTKTPSPHPSNEVHIEAGKAHNTTPAIMSRKGEQRAMETDKQHEPEDDFDSLIPASPLPDPHTEVKIESIEDTTPYNEIGSQMQADSSESLAGPSTDLVIALAEGARMGELHYVTVPATGPARSTRSKTKASLSPVKEGSLGAQPLSRGRRTKESLGRDARMTSSTVTTPTASAVSPVSSSMEQTTESPYNLRSRKVPRAPSATVNSSPRRPGRRLNFSASTSPPHDSSPNLQSPTLESRRIPDVKPHESSQELGDPRESPTTKSLVRDSVEGSLHSEISTNLRSNNSNFTQLQDDEVKGTMRDSRLGSSESPMQRKNAGVSTGSSVVDGIVDVTLSEALTQPTPFTDGKGHPDGRAEDEISIKSSSSVHSEDVSDSETETRLATTLERPSIGLSTPLSYYTALKDLSYFLNRSSQFQSSSTPDVLALVSTSTTAPKRADQGPKHWHVTLHITDVSTFPESTTVQVFRPHSSALPIASQGDIVLLRRFAVKSLKHKAMLLSGDESAWCVWRWSKPVWGVKGGALGELQAREEVRGPTVEKGEGEWKEVERLRAWWMSTVQHALNLVDAKPDDEKLVVEQA